MNTTLECTTKLAQTAIALIQAGTRQEVVNIVHQNLGQCLNAQYTQLILWENNTSVTCSAGKQNLQEHPTKSNRIELRLFRQGLIDGLLEIDLQANQQINTTFQNILNMLADAVADALSKLEQDRIQRHQWRARYSELETIALEDSLTGLGNRRAFEHELTRQAALAQRDGHDVAIAMIDLDGLKTINDTQGHACGDQLLRVFCGAFKSRIRQGDTLYRIGGDEFAMIMPGVQQGSSHVLRRPMQHALETAHARGFNHASASIGFAWLSETSCFESALRLADDRMYLEKHAHHQAARHVTAHPVSGRDENPQRQLQDAR